MTDPRARLRAERSRKAVDAAVALAREHGVACGEPVVLNDLFSLMVHLHPAPVVARVTTSLSKLRPSIGGWHEREIAATTYLAGQGAPVVTPSAELPPGPHEYDGFPISFWTYLEPDPGRLPTTADCAALLVDLHATLRSYPGDVPTYLADDMPALMTLLDQADGVVDQDDVERIGEAHERLRSMWESPDGELQPLHGDAHPGNIMSTSAGFVWIDFEDICRGPVEWDFAAMWDRDAVERHHRPDPELLARCTELRALQVVLSLIAFDDDFGDIEGWAEGIRGMLDALGPTT
jgi:Phosphotransferase enzyme family